VTGKWHGGKGDRPRKQSDQKAYDDGWERIFGQKDKQSQTDQSKKRPMGDIKFMTAGDFIDEQKNDGYCYPGSDAQV